MFRFQTQTARDASGAGIRGGLRRSLLMGWSDSGQDSDLKPQTSMPALPSQTDIFSQAGVVRFVPTADIPEAPRTRTA
jgi:hypothetical protein